MNKPFVIIIGLVLLASLVLFSTTYTIKYHEVGLKTRFGQAGSAEDSVITKSGLGFKWPKPIDDVITLDTRLQMVETPLETIQTADGQQLVVHAFLLWKIDEEGQGPLNFYNNYQYDVTLKDAKESLRRDFRTAVKRGVSNYRFNQLIGVDSQIAQAEAAILREMEQASVREKGVIPVTAGFRQMGLPAKTATAVIGRMNSERKQLAQIERIKGSAEAQRIRSNASIDADKIRAFANQRAEEIRSQGDAEAATYLREMSVDEELAIFLVWIDALEQSLGETTTFILESELAPFHLMSQDAPISSKGIPQPNKAYEFGTRRAATPEAPTEGTLAEGDSNHE